MSWCAVINCNNKTKNNRDVSYFRLPKDTSVHKDWIHGTGFPIDSLPSKIFTCSDHFEEKCFDPSWNCTIKTVKSVEGFYRDQYQLYYLMKRDNKPHLSSEKRTLAQRKEEVIYCFNKVVVQVLRLLHYWKKISAIGFFQGFCINLQNFES